MQISVMTATENIPGVTSIKKLAIGYRILVGWEVPTAVNDAQFGEGSEGAKIRVVKKRPKLVSF
jgi:hypothetical protein